MSSSTPSGESPFASKTHDPTKKTNSRIVVGSLVSSSVGPMQEVSETRRRRTRSQLKGIVICVIERDYYVYFYSLDKIGTFKQTQIREESQLDVTTTTTSIPAYDSRKFLGDAVCVRKYVDSLRPVNEGIVTSKSVSRRVDEMKQGL